MAGLAATGYSCGLLQALQEASGVVQASIEATRGKCVGDHVDSGSGEVAGRFLDSRVHSVHDSLVLDEVFRVPPDTVRVDRNVLRCRENEVRLNCAVC